MHHPNDPVYATQIRNYMVVLPKVKRFNTILLLMSKEEKQLVKVIWVALGGQSGGGSTWCAT
jgi:hypothetical protein